MQNFFDPNQSYTFSNYFFLSNEIDEIVQYFGYSFQRSNLSLPVSQPPSTDSVNILRERISRILPAVRLSSEMARRDLLIAPILIELVYLTNIQLRIEYNLSINNLLKGTLDYYLFNQHNFLVVEAKNADLERGFKQLAVEAIALSEKTQSDLIYGTVTTGDIWQFGLLDNKKRAIVQDMSFYQVPKDLELLLSVLLGIFQ